MRILRFVSMTSIHGRITLRALATLMLNFLVLFAWCQPEVSTFKDVFQIRSHKTDAPITIDGILDDVAWLSANRGTDFWQKVPFFAPNADPKTEVMISYDDDNLYIAAKCWQSEKVIIQSLKRDDYWDSDGIAVMLDPLNTKTNGFLFGVTAAGAQWDALRSLDDINSDWSNKWSSAVHITEEYWSIEMAIPLKILRFAPDSDRWGLNFVRNHINENEYHNWTAVPESFWPPDPAFAGSLIFDTPPTVAGSNFNLIPFVTTQIKSTPTGGTKADIDIGLDARVSITSTLNLDLTINPDFSQVEADELVTNLTRFSIFLPEQRTFFLENSDLFADYGYPAVRPFFSRTIGLDSDRQAVPILYGARLTGNLSKTIRLGVMNVHSLKSDNSPAQNQSAFSIQKMIGRSFVKGQVLNRQAFDGTSAIGGDYGRNTSLEAGYISNNGQFSAWAGAHHSYKPDIEGQTGFYTSGITYQDPNWSLLLAAAKVEENYFADMGFVARIENYDAARDTTIRRGFIDHVFNVGYTFRPTSGPLTRHVLSTDNTLFTDDDYTFNERSNAISYTMAFRSTAEVGLTINNSETVLNYPFGFVSDALPLPVGNYEYTFVSASYESDARKTISYEVEGRTGGFFNGALHQANAGINYRVQPWGNFGVGYQWNRLNFPDEYGQQTITALLSKVEIGFNQNLLWTSLFQFLDQSEFMGINSRLQWRFAPMSDIFFVYVDNYDVFNGMAGPRQVQSNNRAVILKVNYWY